MELKTLELINFRNHRHLKINPSLKTLIIGDNGKGKTNILDAIYYALNPREKCSQERNVSFDQKAAKIALEILKNGTEVSVELIIEEDRKTYKENKKSSNKKHIDLKTVYFKPEDLKITAGQPSDRRAFLNEVCSQINTSYSIDLQDYNKAVKNKNILLKKNSPINYLEPWNRKIAELGSFIYLERKKMCHELQNEANDYFKEFNEGELILKHKSQASGLDPKEEILNLIKERQQDEIVRKISLVGIHRDDVEICVNGVNLTTHGSHGQQRTASFILRMTQADQIEKRWKRPPIILLDDLKSELDSKHRLVVEDIIKGKHQVIATATESCFNEEDFLIIEV